jgi:hypothetical protein
LAKSSPVTNKLRMENWEWGMTKNKPNRMNSQFSILNSRSYRRRSRRLRRGSVKRKLETLRLAGRIEFIGPSKTGTYQLVGT